MSFLQQLAPLNLQEEKQKFFADFSYNPQFCYSGPIDQEKLTKYPHTTPELVALAERIISKKLPENNEAILEKELGRVLTQTEVTQKAKLFLKMHNLDQEIEVVWSASFVSRATMTQTALKLKSTAEFREKETVGMLYHEIGTHALRTYNYKRQSWYRKKKKSGLHGSYLETEEGLAVLHSLIPVENKLLTKSAIRYLAAEKTTQLTFAQLWEFLSTYVLDPEERWTIIVRQKRGLTDTSQPGVFMKDAVYFSGAIKMIAWLQTNSFSLEELYIGKIAVEDLSTAIKIPGNVEPVLPSFYVIDREKYKQQIMEIAAANDLT